jgi:hypothetical protein
MLRLLHFGGRGWCGRHIGAAWSVLVAGVWLNIRAPARGAPVRAILLPAGEAINRHQS